MKKIIFFLAFTVCVFYTQAQGGLDSIYNSAKTYNNTNIVANTQLRAFTINNLVNKVLNGLKYIDTAARFSGGGGGGIGDGDKGDITVSSGIWSIDNNAITTSKLNDAAVTIAKLAGAIDSTKVPALHTQAYYDARYKAIGYNPGLSSILANGNTQAKGDTIFSHAPSQNGLWYKAYRPVSDPYLSRSFTGYGINVYNRANAFTLLQDGQIEMKNPVPFIEMHDTLGVLRYSIGWDPVYKHSFFDRHGSTDHTEEYDANNPYLYIVGPSSNLFPSKYWGCIAWAGMPSYNMIIGNGLFGDPSAASDKDSKLTVYGNLKVQGDSLKLKGKLFANSLNVGVYSKILYWNPSDSMVSTGDAIAPAAQVMRDSTVKINALTSSSSVTPDMDAKNAITISALAANITFNAPTGTLKDMQPLTIRIKDDGTSRTITWNGVYRGSTDIPLPTATTAGKVMYLHFKWNATDNKIDMLALNDGF